MDYIALTNDDIKIMLDEIGESSVKELFKHIGIEKIPQIDIPEEGLEEYELINYISNLFAQNKAIKSYFAGGGYYNHFIPKTVDAISSLPGFYTAYTPYQPEASQGTLTAIYEFQSYIARLTGMEVANASMYDGPTSLAEAILMSLRINKKRKKILISGNLSPIYKKVVDTYLEGFDFEIVKTEYNISNFDLEDTNITEEYASVVIQYPDFFGNIYDFSEFAQKVHDAGALLIVVTYPFSLGLLKNPGSMGADIVCGDGQSLGNYLNFGGSYVGFIATKKKFIRNLPGRIVGKTYDRNGKEGFVLTLQAREQHIRRDNATSNICSNQNLIALRATLYLSLVGKNGLYSLASLAYNNHLLLRELLEKHVKILNNNTFNEFVIELPKAKQFIDFALERDILAGIPLEIFDPQLKDKMLVAVTELTKEGNIKELVKLIEDFKNEYNI